MEMKGLEVLLDFVPLSHTHALTPSLGVTTVVGDRSFPSVTHTQHTPI